MRYVYSENYNYDLHCIEHFIYEIVGYTKRNIVLRELITGDLSKCESIICQIHWFLKFETFYELKAVLNHKNEEKSNMTVLINKYGNILPEYFI